MENRLRFEGRRPYWDQVVRNESGNPVANRTVILGPNLDKAVDAYAEFCLRKEGDRYTSVLSALKETRKQSRELLEKVDEATVEHEVETYGAQLSNVIELYKALETYYQDYLLPPRTGTTGD